LNFNEIVFFVIIPVAQVPNVDSEAIYLLGDTQYKQKIINNFDYTLLLLHKATVNRGVSDHLYTILNRIKTSRVCIMMLDITSVESFKCKKNSGKVGTGEVTVIDELNLNSMIYHLYTKNDSQRRRSINI